MIKSTKRKLNLDLGDQHSKTDKYFKAKVRQMWKSQNQDWDKLIYRTEQIGDLFKVKKFDVARSVLYHFISSY